MMTTMRRAAASTVLWAAAVTVVTAHAVAVAVAIDPALPAYEPRPIPPTASPAETSLFGYNDMRDLLVPLVARVSASHGGLQVGLDLPGTRLAPAALAACKAALAPLGAVLTPPQRAAYRAAVGKDPIEFLIAHASLDPLALSGPLGVFVHADNSVAALALDQVLRAFTGQVLRWGEGGVGGKWKDRPIQRYGVQLGSALACAMQDALQADAASFGKTMRGLPQSAEVVERVAQDPAGVGYAASMRASPAVRRVPLARQAGDAALLPTLQTILAGTYPLDRHLLVYACRPLPPSPASSCA